MRCIFTENQDAGVNAQAAELSKLNHPVLFCSELTKLETPSGLRARLRAKTLSRSNHFRLTLKWEQLVQANIVFLPLNNEIIHAALTVMSNSKVQCRLRSLDCIQFASYLALRRRFSNAIFFAADFALCSLALEHSVPYFNPLSKQP